MSSTYPDSSVLINLPGIRDQAALTKFENLATTYRLAQLQLFPATGSFDTNHIKTIHKHIFQDVYPFAGKIRTENIAKGYFQFAPARYVERELDSLLRGLNQEHNLVGKSMNHFSERAAHYMAEINVIHPFREGNGRTQREFIRTLAIHAGYELDWASRGKEEIMRASIRSTVDPKDLAEIIRSCISPQRSRIDLDRGYER